MKEKILILVGSSIFLLLCVALVSYFFIQSQIFYTQVDNTKIEKLDDRHDMEYEYSLVMYDSNGRKKEISFQTSRVLREGAYLRIQFYPLTGVHAWEEVSFEELPSKVQTHYSSSAFLWYRNRLSMPRV